MPWPVHPTGFFGAQGDNDTYKIERSLRFNSADSAYLNRTNSGSPTNAIKYTISVWAKRGAIGSNQNILGVRNSGTDDSYFRFTNTDEILIGSYSGPGTDYNITSSGVFRDPSAWYHIVCVFDSANATSADRAILYVNGTRQSVTTPGNGMWPQNSTLNKLNTASQVVNLGRRPAFNDLYLDAYLTEFNFIDGQALTPSSFGETDAITGRWKAKAYSGTYGTNGFYLKFADNSGTTSTTLGKDSSGNGNNWTPNNFSVTAGSGNDSLLDSPTNNGTSGNYCTLSAIDKYTSVSLANGNLDASLTSQINGAGGIRATTGVSSGKWYWETTIGTMPSARPYLSIGIDTSNGGNISSLNDAGTGGIATSYVYVGNGTKQNNGSSLSYGATFTTNDVIGVALNLDAGTLEFYKNGTSQGTAYSSLSGTFSPSFSLYTDAASSPMSMSFTSNFGQRPFAYTAPSGFKALCTTNLPTPTIKRPSSAMDVVTYTGNGSARSITGLGFSPDLVWIKGRSGATDHAIYDSVRGVQLDLASNLTSAETTQSQGLTAFNSDGFSIGTLAKLNTNSATYVAWAWDEAPIAGMDIVSYTGNGTNRTIAHNLGVAPKMLIVKDRDSGISDWTTWHSGLTSASYYINLNSTAAQNSAASVWNSTAPTSSNFSLGTNVGVNNSGNRFIAYLFSEVEGFSRFGSYAGNNSSDGPFVWCGFRPRWVLIKDSGFGGTWAIFDAARSTANVIKTYSGANNASAEDSSYDQIDFLSNGFKMRAANATAAANNLSGYTYIFAAFAESPFKYARAR